jgi:hypothetical protein
VVVLGAVGEEAWVPLLVDHYPRGPIDRDDRGAALTRACFSYALCGLTGQPIDRSRWCTDWDEANAARWEAWWVDNGETFRIPLVKPYATWVPRYPLLADDHVARIRSMFTERGDGRSVEYE